jgi:hypothetical protein
MRSGENPAVVTIPLIVEFVLPERARMILQMRYKHNI